MARIKVTGYIETEDMAFEDLDLGHEMGVSDSAYQAFVTGERPLPTLADLEFELVEE